MSREQKSSDLSPKEMMLGCLALLVLAASSFGAGFLLESLLKTRFAFEQEDGPIVTSAAVREEVLGHSMVRVPSGTAEIGRPADPSFEDDQYRGYKRRNLRVRESFWISQFEITKWEWEQVMGTRPWEGRPHVLDVPESPAVYVSFHDAEEFCRVLSEATGELWRLPTEAEWEYAARADSDKHYCFGDGFWSGDPKQVALCDEYMQHYYWLADRFPFAQRVGELRPNSWFLFDVHGNVQEWCVFSDPQARPGETAPACGGSWRHHPDRMMVWLREYLRKEEKNEFTGFRVVREPCAPEKKSLFSFSEQPQGYEWRAKLTKTNGFEYRHPMQRKAHMGPVTAMDIDPSGQFAITSSMDCTLKLWSTADGTLLNTFVRDEPYTCLKLSSGGGYAVLGERRSDRSLLYEDLYGDIGVRFTPVWDLQEDEVVHNLRATLDAVAFSRDGFWLAVLDVPRLILYSVSTWEERHDFFLDGLSVDATAPFAVGFGPDDTTVTAMSGSFRFTYRINDGALVYRSRATEQLFSTHSVALLPSGPYLAAYGSFLREFHHDQVHDYSLERRYSFSEGPRALLPGGRYFLDSFEGMRLDLMTLPNWAIVKSFPITAEGLVSAADGKRVGAYEGSYAWMFTIEGEPHTAYFFDPAAQGRNGRVDLLESVPDATEQ